MHPSENARRAVISLGTNTARLLVIEDAPNGRVKQIEHLAVGTRLGEGLHERGALGETPMRRTLEAVAAFTQAAGRHAAMIACIATSAVRRAENAADFEARVRAITGAPLRVISGEEEAAASFRGATYEEECDGEASGGDGNGDSARRVAVLDIGGGSTECAVGSSGVVERSVSLEIGTVRLTERFPELGGATPGPRAFEAALRAHALVGEIMRPLGMFPRPNALRAVAGTPATIAAVITQTDVEHVRGVQLSQAEVRSVLDRLLNATLEQRRAMPGMLAQRADVLAAGAIMLDTAMELLECPTLRVETNDLLLGYLAGEYVEPSR